MKKLYEKNELTFAIVNIVIYCVLQSQTNSLNEVIGIKFSASALFAILQAVILFSFVRSNSLMQRYGLFKSSVPANRFLYYIPLVILATGNLWNGVAMNYSLAGTVCRVASMLCVGFLEELIFRGFLFKAMEKTNVRNAIIVSSLTFGIGHLVNLVNGSGMAFVENLCQVVFAIAVGFLFVTLFYRGESLIPCIVTHSAINSLNTFANGAGVTARQQMAHVIIMIAVAVAYTFLLIKTLPKKQTAPAK